MIPQVPYRLKNQRLAQNVFKKTLFALPFLCSFTSALALEEEVIHAENERDPSEIPAVDKPFGINARVSALGFFLGEFGFNYDVAISDTVTLGPRLALYSYSIAKQKNTEGYEIGLRSNFFFRGTPSTDSWYVGPSLIYVDTTVENILSQNQGEHVHGVEVDVFGGYQWAWQSGFNIELGAGPSYAYSRNAMDSQLSGTKETAADQVQAAVHLITGKLELTAGILF